MPTYEYHCSNCQTTQEIVQKITAEPIHICPLCQKKTLKRGPGGGMGLQFKGSGFYLTDYCGQNQEKEEKEPEKIDTNQEKK